MHNIHSLCREQLCTGRYEGMEDKGEEDKKEKVAKNCWQRSYLIIQEDLVALATNEVESIDENVVTLTETADKKKQRKNEKDKEKENEKQVL